MDNGQLRNPFGMIEICEKCPKQLEFFYNRPAADTIIVNCQLSIVNSAKPLNSNLSVYLQKQPIVQCPFLTSKTGAPDFHGACSHRAGSAWAGPARFSYPPWIFRGRRPGSLPPRGRNPCRLSPCRRSPYGWLPGG